MRPDQIERLNELAERLADVFITEADPENWSGGGKLPRDMTKDERGNRHWDRKGALGTGAVLRYTLDVLAHGQKPAGDPADPGKADGDLEVKIQEAEKRAAAAVERVLNKAKGKAEFDRRTHGAQG